MCFQRGKPDHLSQKPLRQLSIPYFVQHDQKGKNKYNTIGWQIKRSQYLKIHFTAIKITILIEYGQKVDFLIRPLDRVNFGPSRRAHFPFQTTVYRPKSELKQIRYHQNSKNPNKIFTL